MSYESSNAFVEYPLEIYHILTDFCNIVPDELFDEFPLLRYFQHAIDFVRESSLSNLSYYKMNPFEHTKLRRYGELLKKSFIRGSLSSYVSPALLTSKDNTWRIYVDSCAISRIIVKYSFQFLDLMTYWAMMAGSHIFSNINLRIEYH